MPGSRDARTRKSLTHEVEEMKIEGDIADKSALRGQSVAMEDDDARPASARRDAPLRRVKQSPQSPASRQTSAAQSPIVKADREETIGGDITVKVEPGKAPKLSRTMSQKVIQKPRKLFSHLQDSTDEATETFDVLHDCTYAARYLGVTEQALECDCTEEWDPKAHINNACGEDSDCINRATKMECPEDCGCGDGCQNRRFQRKQYADVSVIKTENKGYGLRANQALKANDFIFEYIGEVISDPAFRRRMHQYDEEGIKHFYFMSLSKGEFVDATKKGNLGRFCNHSCNPNCFVDKWVVGERLRMGIFAERQIEAGEELTFNYNVDRYGAEPQACYCGEPNCSGFIGGKTQTGGSSVTLSSSTQIALGIWNNEDWDTATQKKPRKKKASEDDEEYVDSVEVKPPGLGDIVNVMGELYKNPEKWIVVKLLSRLQQTDDDRVRLKAAKLHGYNVFNKLLKAYADDTNVLLQILDILNKIPRLTRNKISDSKIDVTVGALVDHENDQVKEQTNKILNEWSKLEMGYRIPRVKRDPNAVQAEKRLDRSDRKTRDRSRSRSRSRSKSVEAPKGPSIKAPTAPSGPRGNQPQRGFFQGGGRPPFRHRPPPGELPSGWFEAVAQNGSRYYYNAGGATTWQRPSQPAMGAPPPPPPKVMSDKQQLDDLIQNIVNNNNNTPRAERPLASATPIEPVKVKAEEKWRALPDEKQRRHYENTLAPSISHVANKYKDRLPRDEIKKHAKDAAKKLVSSDFKHNRVTDLYKIDARKEKSVKKFVVEYFDKAVKTKKANEAGGKTSTIPIGSPNPSADVKLDDVMDMSGMEAGNGVSDTSAEKESTTSPSTLKRRREEVEEEAAITPTDVDLMGKKARLDASTAPPPPPPPPTEGAAGEEDGDNDESIAEGFTIKGVARGLQRVSKYGESPMQVATPPTTGSPDEDERERRRREFSGVNADRMRHMGFMDGANDQ